MTAAAITTWMLYSLCVGVVVAVAALMAAEAQRVAGRSVRWVWAGAIIAIVSLTLAAPMRRSDHSANISLLTSPSSAAHRTMHPPFPASVFGTPRRALRSRCRSVKHSAPCSR
jgi:hypothetical protein